MRNSSQTGSAAAAGKAGAAARQKSGRPRSHGARHDPQVRFRLRITAGEHIAVGPGKIALLEAIRATGSLTAAAKSLEMSYRRAWLLLDELNGSLAVPAVESAKGGANGGGSVLTPTGEQLVETYRRIERTATDSSARDIRRLVAMLAR